MQEKEPLYIKELKIDLKNDIKELRIDFKSDIKELRIDFKSDIKELKDHLDEKIEKEVGGLAIMTANHFFRIEKEMAINKEELKDDIREIHQTMATKEDLKPILQHIGAYEMRARNIEDILLHDHKPRIVDLEKIVYM